MSLFFIVILAKKSVIEILEEKRFNLITVKLPIIFDKA